MSYVNFKATVKKMNIKAGNVQEVVLEISGGELDGQLEKIAQMVDSRAQIEIEAAIINYKIEINAATQEPMIHYKVNDDGIVAEVSAPDQMELEGMPPEKIQTEEKDVKIDRKIVDDFILSGLAPTYSGYRDDIVDILKRHIEGESYLKLATELNISSGVIVEQANKYRMEIAPLAKGWADYVKSQEDKD